MRGQVGVEVGFSRLQSAVVDQPALVDMGPQQLAEAGVVQVRAAGLALIAFTEHDRRRSEEALEAVALE
jgi:hypothetical protein